MMRSAQLSKSKVLLKTAIYCSVFILFFSSCNFSNKKEDAAEVNGINTAIVISEKFPEKIKNDQRVVDYLNEYHETLHKFYGNQYKDMIITGANIFMKVGGAIVDAMPLLILESRRNSFKEEFSDEKMGLIYKEEAKIGKVINYSFYKAVNDKEKNSYRQEIASNLSDTEESLAQQIENVRKLTNDLDYNAAEFRYYYSMNFFYMDKESNISNLTIDIEKINTSRKQYELSDPIISKYDVGSKERELIESFVSLINEISNQNYDYKKTQDGWSDKKKRDYKKFFDAIDNAVEWNIASLKDKLVLIKPIDFYNIQKLKK